ncbi:MAG: hypothetical protein C0184_12450 [Chloroflexus aggregans]|uniref:Uncharacterized protein n=1 Tax=Chloroflexus aggregans TaxID=152260 RepID=A0A2J6WZW3_9CHLR|nr:MAG: hypothetical protein C0184_12450 [Chloroflexus aggregans]
MKRSARADVSRFPGDQVRRQITLAPQATEENSISSKERIEANQKNVRFTGNLLIRLRRHS